MFKKKEPSEFEVALREMIDARVELERITTLFDYVEPDYFEIINSELTIARMHYDVCVQKLRKMQADTTMDLFYNIVY